MNVTSIQRTRVLFKEMNQRHGKLPGIMPPRVGLIRKIRADRA